MMRRLVWVTDCFLLLCATGCYPQHTIYIGPASSSVPATIEGYAKKGSTVEWAVSSPGESYTINFPYSTPPCEDATTSLTATYKNPAKCKIVLPRGYPKDQDPLRYEYTIHDNNSKKDAAPPQQYYQRVGSCDTCASPKGNLAASPTPPAPTGVAHTVTISCKPLSPDPLAVSVGDVIYWNNPSGKSKPKFTVAFSSSSGAPCTIVNSSGSSTCNVTTAGSGPYTVTVGDGHSNGGCTVNGTINASAASQ